MSQIEAITHMKKTILTPFYVEKARPSVGQEKPTLARAGYVR
jgi:hypothetical protein